jgi:hypothetical protein
VVPTLDIAERSSYDGEVCYVMVAFDLTGLSQGAIGLLMAESGGVRAFMKPCPDQPAGAAPPVQAVPPQQLATAFWDTIKLPAPNPTSHPDYAVTGKVTYVDAGDSNDPAPWTRETPYGLLTIKAHGSYTVEWGDGTPTTGPYDNPGGSYPAGDITHTYDDVGTVTITVREDWTATWTIGDIHGDLGGLHTTGTLPGFPVRQIQAVVTGSS